MKTRAQEVCKILNRHSYLGYTDWQVHPDDNLSRYIIGGPGIEQVLTIYEAFEVAVQLEAESGVKFGRDVDEC